MSRLVIGDLAVNRELDQAAVKKICGGINGFSLGWAIARLRQDRQGPAPGIAPVNFVSITTNNFINPTIFNVHNGADNSGTMTTNIAPIILQSGV